MTSLIERMVKVRLIPFFYGRNNPDWFNVFTLLFPAIFHNSPAGFLPKFFLDVSQLFVAVYCVV